MAEDEEKVAKQKKEEAKKRAMTSIRPSKEPFDAQKRQKDLAALFEPLPLDATLAERLARHEKVGKLSAKHVYEAPDPVIELLDKTFGLQKADYKNTVDYENFVQLCKAVLPTNSIIGEGIPTWNDYMRPSLKKFTGFNNQNTQLSARDWRYAKIMEILTLTAAGLAPFLTTQLKENYTPEEITKLKELQTLAMAAFFGLDFAFEDIFELRVGNFSSEFKDTNPPSRWKKLASLETERFGKTMLTGKISEAYKTMRDHEVARLETRAMNKGLSVPELIRREGWTSESAMVAQPLPIGYGPRGGFPRGRGGRAVRPFFGPRGGRGGWYNHDQGNFRGSGRGGRGTGPRSDNWNNAAQENQDHHQGSRGRGTPPKGPRPYRPRGQPHRGY